MLCWSCLRNVQGAIRHFRGRWALALPAPACSTSLGRAGRSSPPGLAGPLGLAARARSASLGRSKWLLEAARSRWGELAARTRSGAFPETIEIAVRGCWASLELEHSNRLLEPGRLRTNKLFENDAFATRSGHPDQCFEQGYSSSQFWKIDAERYVA